MENGRNSRRTYYAPALEKGLDILEALSASPIPQTLADLARSLNRTSSELFRMLTTLENRGYIQKEAPGGHYSCTLRLFQLAHTHSPVDQLLYAALLPMRKLSERIRESCHLGMLRHNQLVVLAQAESPEKLRLSVEVGSGFPVVHTASGRLLLAHLGPKEFSNFCETSPEFIRLTATERRHLLSKLGEIRRRGYSAANGEPSAGLRGLAVLAGDPDVGFMAALAVPSLIIPGRKHSARSILKAALQTSAEINRALGLTA